MNDYQRYLADEFVEDYQEGRLSRRDALKMIASVMGSLALAPTFLAACAPPPAAPAPPPAALPPTNTAGASSTAANAPAAELTPAGAEATSASSPAPTSGTVS